MKREFLEGLGLDKAKVDQVMVEYGKELQAEQQKVTAKEAELTAANGTIKNLQESIKKFDGVDIVKLQNDAKDWETKYNTDVEAERVKADNIRKEYSLKEALKAKGVSEPDYLIYKQGGVEKFAFDDKGVAIGLDDILKPYQESSPSLFTSTEGGQHVDTGANNDNGGTGGESSNQAFNDIIRGAFK